jgi:vacuolar-type H+-ATPase subunit H
MDPHEGKAALEEIKTLERRLDMRLKEAKAKATQLVEDAEANAAEMIREKERKIDGLKFSPRSLRGEETETAPKNIKLDEKLAEDIAREIVEIITSKR